MNALSDIYESIIHVKDARRKLDDAGHSAGSLSNIVGGVCFIHSSRLSLSAEERAHLTKAAALLQSAELEIQAFLETAWKEAEQ